MYYSSWITAEARAAFQRQIERAIELGLPVPGIRRPRNYSYFRNPRCHGLYREEGRRQRTANILVDGVRVRSKLHRPPNAYDDIPIKARDNRNWKRFRRTRWKA